MITKETNKISGEIGKGQRELVTGFLLTCRMTLAKSQEPQTHRGNPKAFDTTFLDSICSSNSGCPSKNVRVLIKGNEASL